jgi:hypothetical protein
MTLSSLSIYVVFVDPQQGNKDVCRCLTTDSLPRGYPGQLFGLRHVVELDGECKDSRFILVQALDR